jgi:hypothetical protein
VLCSIAHSRPSGGGAAIAPRAVAFDVLLDRKFSVVVSSAPNTEFGGSQNFVREIFKEGSKSLILEIWFWTWDYGTAAQAKLGRSRQSGNSLCRGPDSDFYCLVVSF